MAKPKGGLTAWFGKGPKGDWVDIGAPKKKGKFQKCGRKSAKGGSKRKYPKCVPRSKAKRMTEAERKSAVRIKFATPADARATVAKVKKVKKPFARKIQILTVGEQRAKVMGKTAVASIFKKGKEAIRRTRKKKSGKA